MRTALCTCCREPRTIYQDAPGEEWAHLDDETFAEVFHIHTSTESRDCDGRYYHGGVLRINTYNETAGVTDKGDLWRKAVEHAITAHGHCTAEINGEEHTAEVNERTDEGYRNTSLQGCTDLECAYDESEQRDYTAEAAGY